MKPSQRRPVRAAHLGCRGLVIAALATVLLAGCGGGGSRSVVVERQESNRQDLLTAAVAPVLEGRAVPAPEVSRWWIQKTLADTLDAANTFDGVIRLEARHAENEAGLILEPTLTDLRWSDPAQSGGEVSIRLRAVDKFSGQVKLDRVYSGGCKRCPVPPGEPPIVGPASEVARAIDRDLRGRFGG